MLEAVTALGPNDPDDGDAGRQARGLAIAAVVNITKNKLGYKVPSQSGHGAYVVNASEHNPCCTCPDFENRKARCKHVYAVEFLIQREERVDGTVVNTRGVRVTYGQDWPAYNAAQTHEGEHFVVLLRDLCESVVEQPRHQGKGRPRLPLQDVVLGIGLKVYSTFPGRRAMSNIRTAQANGLIDHVPSFTSVARYLENPALTPVLKSLIEQSALPLSSVEVDFAVDSSAFSTTTYHRWYDHKWSKTIKESQWVKAHLIAGVKTNIVTSAEVTVTQAHDSQYWPAFVETTAQNFKLNEVSGDKAYLSRKNLWVVQALGGTAYIPFKTNSVAHNSKAAGDHLWLRMFHYYNYNREEFLQHYHKRSNVEATFHMIKTKFGARVRSKTPTAQVNEVLTKILCHNVCVLIQSVYELGVTPVFSPPKIIGTEEASCSQNGLGIGFLEQSHLPP